MFAGWFQLSIDGKQATLRCSGLGQPISWLPFYGSGIWTGLSLGFLGDSDGKESACNARDQGSVPALGRPPGEGTGKPILYVCLETSMDRRACQATVHGITKSRTRLNKMNWDAFSSACMSISVPRGDGWDNSNDSREFKIASFTWLGTGSWPGCPIFLM